MGQLAMFEQRRKQQSDDGLSFDLPWAPSVNRYWRHTLIGGHPRVLLSVEGRAFRKAAAQALMLQGVVLAKLNGRLGVDISLHAPDRRITDIDNRIKGLLDALTHAKVWLDDSQVDDLHVRRGYVVKNGLCRVRVRTLAYEEITPT